MFKPYKDCGLGSKSSLPVRISLLRRAYSHYPHLYIQHISYKDMGFGRSSEEAEEKPKKNCSCTIDVRDIVCTQHGG